MKKISSAIGAFLQTPVGVILTTTVIWHVAVWAVGIKYSYSYTYVVSLVLLGVDIFVAFYLLDRLIYFFSQFVLPIQNPNYRQEIYLRVKNFETGSRGPALFVKNGRVIMHEGEADKRGPGLIVLDTASALVLRTDTEIKDTAGPGVKFTKGNEYIAGSVDLRSQWQYIDPRTGEQQTNGLTRDGFDVSPVISIKFSIKRPVKKTPTEGGVISQYGYDADAVRNAVTREAVQLGAAENGQARMEWNQLPAHLVVNVWREYVRKFRLGDLLTSSGASGLQIIETMINKRVKQESVEALDDTGSQTGEWIKSREFAHLQSRGLEITDMRIHNVIFDDDTEKQIVEQWSATWLNSARKEENFLKEKESLIGMASRDEASKSFAKLVSRQFGGKPTMPQENPFKTLQLLIQPLREFIITQSGSVGVEAELRKLDDIWKWLLENSAEAHDAQGGD